MSNLNNLLDVPHIEEKILDSFLLNKRYSQYCGNLREIVSYMKKYFILGADANGEFDVEGVIEEITICLEDPNGSFFVSNVNEKIEVSVFDVFGKKIKAEAYSNYLDYEKVQKDFESYASGFELVIKTINNERESILDFLLKNIDEILLKLLNNTCYNLNIGSNPTTVKHCIDLLENSIKVCKGLKYINAFKKTKDYKYLLTFIKYDLMAELKRNYEDDYPRNFY